MAELLANTVIMVRPKAFGFNPETAASNAFQHEEKALSFEDIQKEALKEFDGFAAALMAAGVKVLIFEDEKSPKTPDAIFPNNWFCTLPTGQAFTFPMAAKTRRLERRSDILTALEEKYGYEVDRFLEPFEKGGRALEGTGSLVLDHKNRLAYAAISPRTDKKALLAFEALSGYLAVPFRANGPDGAPIYHTNVMMALGPDFAIIGADTLDKAEKGYVLGVLEKSGKKVLTLTNDQVFTSFAGNMLCLRGKGGQRLLVMSQAAEKSLTNAQRDRIMGDFNCAIISSPLALIERLGGGSARCMLAEVFKTHKIG